MSDAPRFPAGWYADPDNPSVHRWWDGARWTEARQPAYGVQPAPAQQFPPQPPLPTSQYSVNTAAPYNAAPPANTSAPTTTSAPANTDAPTNTVWIWLVVLLPLLSLPTLFLLDWRGLIEDIARQSTLPTGSSTTWVMSWTVGSLAISALGWVIIAAQVLFAFLDWRALRRRGIDRPFHWAWIFFTLVISSGVYVIGRAVVLRRRGARGGMAPVVAWIVVTVLGFAVGIAFAVYLFNELFAILASEGLLTPGVAP
jgi:hypothetical protein